jgi:hypothetical protein
MTTITIDPHIDGHANTNVNIPNRWLCEQNKHSLLNNSQSNLAKLEANSLCEDILSCVTRYYVPNDMGCRALASKINYVKIVFTYDHYGSNLMKLKQNQFSL